MLGYYYGFDYTYLVLVLPAVLLAMWAQFMVNSTYKKYEKTRSRQGVTAGMVARRILDENGLQNIRIDYISGHLTDHYDPAAGAVRLSDADSTSIAAIGVAAHEVGHAIQHAQGYFPLKLRTMIIPVTNIGSQLALPLLMVGLLLNFQGLTIVGIALFGLSAVFQLVTLPVEFNASRRAIRTLESDAILDRSELSGAKKVLSAAAMTYVAALAVSLAQLLRLIILFGNRRDRD